MSSSSSSSANPQWIYDVFLNFRGEDTRNGIVSHLYSSLSNAGVNVFLDSEKLHKGVELGGELLRAIEGSQISIVVFSETYAESSWCLNELVKIIECRTSFGQVVVPIFYDVDPAVVRHQKGCFGANLEALSRKRYSEESESVLSSWKSALTQAATLSGWDFSDCVRSEAELLEKIVEDVLAKLDNRVLSITDFPVGLKSRVQQLIRIIERRSGCIIGIWGMGGLGKTTAAKAIYNQIHRKFTNRCFIENIREVCEKDCRGHIRLQKQLLFNILKTKVKIDNSSSGTTMIERRLYRKKSLIVLDDVNKFDQLQALCGNGKWMAKSVLIITTRDVGLLKFLKVDHVCKLEELNETESLELLSWHAFRKVSPKEDFSELSKKVVAYCGGLPLALEVLGSHLYERTELEWRSVLSKLQRIPNDHVQEKLRISYDGLDDEEKNIFLDICCFFIGKDRAYVTEVLSGCGFYPEIGIQVLMERSLIRVEKNNRLGMHDLLRDMGREIVRQSSPQEPEKRSRLWECEVVLDVLTEQIGTKVIEGLALKLERTSRDCFDTKAFEKMKKLRLLRFDHVQLIGDYGNLPRHLRWVYWKGFHLQHLPNNFYQGNVVAIDLKYSNIKQVWKETPLLDKLKILTLSHSRYMTHTPDFSHLPNLEKLILKDCPNLSNVHQSVGDLSNLLVINLEDCTSLRKLPRKFYQLKCLKTLILSGCSKFDKLREDVVQLESLTTLIGKDTAIKEMPRSILRSKSIGYISLCGYEGLARDVFPSIIRSWMSPTMNPLSYIHPLRGMSSSLVSVDVQNNNFGHLAPLISNLSKLRSIWVHCDSEFQLTQELSRILDDLYNVNISELETSSYVSYDSDISLKSYLIGMGSYHTVIDTIGKSISQGLASGSGNFSPPEGNYPCYKGEGHSVIFNVPQDSDHHLKGMILCVVYSSIQENMATETENLISVLIANHTKCTIQIYKRETAISFNDEEWLAIISNLEPGDLVEFLVAFGYGLTIKMTAVYLIYGESSSVKIEPPPPKPKKGSFTKLVNRMRKLRLETE